MIRFPGVSVHEQQDLSRLQDDDRLPYFMGQSWVSNLHSHLTFHSPQPCSQFPPWFHSLTSISCSCCLLLLWHWAPPHQHFSFIRPSGQLRSLVLLSAWGTPIGRVFIYGCCLPGVLQYRRFSKAYTICVCVWLRWQVHCEKRNMSKHHHCWQHMLNARRLLFTGVHWVKIQQTSEIWHTRIDSEYFYFWARVFKLDTFQGSAQYCIRNKNLLLAKGRSTPVLKMRIFQGLCGSDTFSLNV